MTDAAGSLFSFGKHKGKTFAEVVAKEPGYVRWVLEQAEPNGQLLDFKNFCSSSPAASAAAASASASRSSLPPSSSAKKPPVAKINETLHGTFRLEMYVGTETWRAINAIPGLRLVSGSNREWQLENPDDTAARDAALAQLGQLVPIERPAEWVKRLVEAYAVATPTKRPDDAVVRLDAAEQLQYARDFPEKFSELLPYQKECVLECLSGGDGGMRRLLALEMGLGKSVIALVAMYQQLFGGGGGGGGGKWLLIVCPASIRFVWVEQLMRWLSLERHRIFVLSKSTDVLPSGGSQPSMAASASASASGLRVVIVSYNLLAANEHFQSRPAGDGTRTGGGGGGGCSYEAVIVDESHYVKDLSSKRTRAVLPVVKKAKQVLLLTGTPVLNKSEDLYPQVSGLWTAAATPTLKEFRERYAELSTFRVPHARFPIEKWTGCKNREELNALLLGTVMTRRTKEQVKLQLPDKVRIKVPLSPADSSTSRELQRLKTGASDGTQGVIEMWRLTGEAKTAESLEYMEDLLESSEVGEKVLIFAHHRFVLDKIEQKIVALKLDYVRIDGHTPQDRRGALVEKFQNSNTCKVAVLSITACSEGITLTAASVVVFAELYWVPGIMEQAEARAHRVGSNRGTVFVHYLVLPDSPDEMVFSSLERKKKDTTAIVDGKQQGLQTQSAQVLQATTGFLSQRTATQEPEAKKPRRDL